MKKAMKSRGCGFIAAPAMPVSEVSADKDVPKWAKPGGRLSCHPPEDKSKNETERLLA